MVSSMKKITLWDIASCSLVEVDQRFRNVYCLHYQGDELSMLLRHSVPQAEVIKAFLINWLYPFGHIN
jgi:hypothetical protein